VKGGRRSLVWRAFRVDNFRRSVREGLSFRGGGRLQVLRPAYRLFAEQDGRLTEKLRLHVREDAVKVECDT
jgi:hypothetical protein